MKYTIRYQYGSYSGEETIYAEEGEEAIRKMWRRLGRYMTLPMATQLARIIAEEEEDE